MPANTKKESDNQTVDEQIKAVLRDIGETANAVDEAYDKLMDSKVEKLPDRENYKDDAEFHYKMAMGKRRLITEEKTKLFRINQLYINSPKEPVSGDEQKNVAAAKNEIRKNLSDRLYDLKEQQGRLNTILEEISPHEKLAQEQSAAPQVVSPQLQSTDKSTPQLGAKASQTQSEKTRSES